MNKFIYKYKSMLDDNIISYDINQERVVDKLGVVFDKLVSKNKTDFFFDFFNRFSVKKDNDILLGLYIWGGVGRGKTYLVDLFFSSLPIKEKLRVHFYHFMSLIHNKLKEFTGIKNPLKLVAKIFSEKYRIICLDEFFVKDIGDAMILSELFHHFFEYGIIFIITSNVVPCNLYINGLQRQKFISTIILLEKKLEIVNVDSNLNDIDYRLRNLEEGKIYLYPLILENFKLFKIMFLKLSIIDPKKDGVIKILGRKISYIYMSGSIIWFDFNIICGSGRSQLDYIEIASLFNIVFISNICILTTTDEDKARRFIALIDEFYDRKVNVVLLSEVDMECIYNGVLLKFDFERTRSRLIEMKTKEYLKESCCYEL